MYEYLCTLYRYILPAVLAAGLLENGVCVLVLTSLSCGIGRTARVYYITLSLVDMCLLVAQTYNMWLSMGLQYATGGAFYLDVRSSLTHFYMYITCSVI